MVRRESPFQERRNGARCDARIRCEVSKIVRNRTICLDRNRYHPGPVSTSVGEAATAHQNNSGRSVRLLAAGSGALTCGSRGVLAGSDCHVVMAAVSMSAWREGKVRGGNSSMLPVVDGPHGGCDFIGSPTRQ